MSCQMAGRLVSLCRKQACPHTPSRSGLTCLAPRPTVARRFATNSPAVLQPHSSRAPRHASQDFCCHGLISPDIIAQPFVTANSTVCIPWLMMILAPNWSVTQKVFKSEWSMVVPGAVFTFFFVAAAFIETSSPIELLQKVKFLFLDAIADPEKMRAFLSSGPGYAAQDWIHLIAWDLIGGRWIYLDGLEKRVPTWHSLMITFGGGPLGLLVHFVTRRFSQNISIDSTQ